jgi:hypothetical protein
MKKLILLVLIGLAGWQIYAKQSTPVITNADLKLLNEPMKSTNLSSQSDAQNYSCDGRQYCSQMNSRAEAVFFINNCPNTKMDGDYDGVPCESDSRF